MDITCIRHSVSNKSSSDDHRNHILSAEGVELAKRRRELLGNPEFDLVLCSPLIRTRQTAQLVAGLESDETIITVPDLFYEDDSEHGQLLNAMFERLGHATLKKYLEDPNGDAMRVIGKHGWQGVLAKIGVYKSHTRRLPERVLVVGHGVLINMLGISMGVPADRLVHRAHKETQGFTVINLSGTVTLTKRVALID
ncbi:MAG: histidine phosphatase family protein [Candidatus Paceibacterota bacterium]